MANILKELTGIKEAVYGEEVRGSIHDAIEKINTAAEDAITQMQGIVDTAVAQINALSSDYEDLLEGDVATNLSNAVTSLKGEVDAINERVPAVDNAISSTSKNPVQNQTIYVALNGKSDINHSHTASGLGVLGANDTAVAAAKLATARTITVGNSGKSFDGSASISFSLSEIGAAAVSHGVHVPAKETANNARFLRNDGTWQTVTPANIGALASGASAAAATKLANARAIKIGNKSQNFDGTSALTYTLSDIGAAAASHGNHLPALEKANNAKFLRNDGTWQTVTPANIGAAALSHGHSYLSTTGGTVSGAVTINGALSAYSLYQDAARRVIVTTNDSGARVASLWTASTPALHLRAEHGKSGTYDVLSVGLSTSDIRLKENVNDSEIQNALEIVNSIKLRSFDWKETGEHQRIGFVADELEGLDPKFTMGGGYDEDGTMLIKSVDVLYLLGYLTKAVQEMSAVLAKNGLM